MTALLLTLKVATAATVLVWLPGTALGYLLARGRFRGRDVLGTVLGQPLVIPPTAVGFLLLQLLSVDSPAGQLLRPDRRR